MALSSPPAASLTDRPGVSATALTVTARLPVLLAVSPSSLAVAVTVREKSASELAGGVTVRAAWFQAETST